MCVSNVLLKCSIQIGCLAGDELVEFICQSNDDITRPLIAPASLRPISHIVRR